MAGRDRRRGRQLGREVIRSFFERFDMWPPTAFQGGDLEVKPMTALDVELPMRIATVGMSQSGGKRAYTGCEGTMVPTSTDRSSESLCL
jgi:hypothetical protein